MKSRRKFDNDAKKQWLKLSTEPIYCTACLGTGVTRSDAELVYCNGICQRKLPDYHYVDTMLLEWQTKDAPLAARCARCVIKAKDKEAVEGTDYACTLCHVEKNIVEFSPVAIKEWMGQKFNTQRWKCYDCQYPACAMCETENRPIHAIPHNALIDGKYYCADHRNPPCTGCGKQRLGKNTDQRFKQYTCKECVASSRKSATSEILETQARECEECLKEMPLNSFRRDSDGVTMKRCKECEHPLCASCGTQHPREKDAIPRSRKEIDASYICDTCKYTQDCEECLKRFRSLLSDVSQIVI